MKEKDFQTLFSKVCKMPGAFELKLCKGNALPYSALKDHQIEALMKVRTKNGLFHKISDNPIFSGMKTRFHSKKPFDCFYLQDFPAYVVVIFYKPRKPKIAYLIDIIDFLQASSNDTRKSLTEEKTKELSTTYLQL